MSAAFQRPPRPPSMSPAERARLLAKYHSEIAARDATDPTAPYRSLHARALPAYVRASWNWPEPLSELYTMQRKAALLQAWAALQVARIDPTIAKNWRHAARLALAEAKRFGKLARVEIARETMKRIFA